MGVGSAVCRQHPVSLHPTPTCAQRWACMSAGNRVEATNADKAIPDLPITTYLNILGEQQDVST